MDVTTLNIVVGLCLATGFVMLFMVFVPSNMNFLSRRLEEGNDYVAGTIDKKDGRYALLQVLLPYAQKLSEKNAGKVHKDKLKDLDRKLLLAGSPLAIKPIELYNMRYVGAISFFIIGCIFGFAMDFGPVLGVFAGAIGFVLPNMVISSLIKKRATQCDMELPEVLDLLSVCMDSSMTPTMAIETVCSKNEGLLVDELRFVLEDTRRGASLVQAFEGLLRRVDSKRLGKLLQAIRMSARYGTPVATQLKTLSGFIRNDTCELVKQHAAKAASTVMIPVILFILPAMVLIVAGPLILRAMAGA